MPFVAEILPNLLSSVSKLKSALFLLADLLSIIWSLIYYENGCVLEGEMRERHYEHSSVVLLDIPVDKRFKGWLFELFKADFEFDLLLLESDIYFCSSVYNDWIS